ncbi:ATP-binding protein [Anaerovorax odorimutans]|uniref:ATP-binding protein n=1 Tax=Anaerovorax odorimutans TaxID=109327 RepID=UPI0004079065|nr:ATP-binding protein [Anaerovorax odorimutans]
MKNKFAFGIIVIILISILFSYYYYNNVKNHNTKMGIDITNTLTPQEQTFIKNNKKIKIGVSDQLSPLVFIDEEDEGKVKGLAVDFMDIIAEQLNQDVEYVFLNQDELKDSLINQQLDGAIMSYRREDKKVFSFTIPIIPVKGVTAKLIDSGQSKDDEELSASSDPVNLIDTRNVPSVEATIKDILADKNINEEKKVTAVLGNEPALRYFIEKNYALDQFVFSRDYKYDGNFCIALNSNNEILYKILNKSIYKLDKNFILSQLQGKWFTISYPLEKKGITESISILFTIIIASVLCVFYIFYGTNKALYEELGSRMEQVLDSKNELQTTFDGVSYYMIEIDLKGKIVNVNKAFREFLREKETLLIGKELTEILDMELENKELLTNIILQGIKKGEEQKKEIVSGKKILTCRVFPVKNAREKVVKILVTIQDVTREKTAERQMVQDNKMIAVGQLAAGVAHEIRNPLGLIRNYCYVLKNSKQEDSLKREKAICVIEKAVDKSGKIIDNLLNFSRKSNHEKELIKLKSHINSVISLQQNRAIKNSIEIKLECSTLLETFVLVESFDMVLINLTANALDAIESQISKEDIKGLLSISCIEDGNYINIVVEDNGEGIPKNIQEEIFNPFFTTKEKRDGNGLGLYIVYNEIQKMNGRIQVESTVGKGTRFTVVIPKVEVGQNE